MARKEQTKELMVNAMAASGPRCTERAGVQRLPSEHPPRRTTWVAIMPLPRTRVGGATEAQFGPYRVVILNVWSAIRSAIGGRSRALANGCNLPARFAVDLRRRLGIKI